MPDQARISSTTPWEEEIARERAQQQAADERAAVIRRNLLNAGRETATEYGRQLFRVYVERVSNALEALFGRILRKQVLAGPHYCALPALLAFQNQGLRPVAALAMSVVLDRISVARAYKDVAMAIGREIENEVRALGVSATDRALLRLLKKRHASRRSVVAKHVLEQLHLGIDPWAPSDRHHVGALLLELVVAHTGLVRVITEAKGRQRLEPTDEVRALIKANPPLPIPVKRLPMLVEPRPWEGLYGGGHLDNKSAVIVARRPIDLTPYKQADISVQLRAINALQSQALVMDPWMVALQREAWDSNIRGLYPLTRDPMRVPPQPEPGEGKEAWKAWHRQQQQAWLDETKGRGQRLRIEEELRQCEAVAGRTVWFAHNLDFRGRIYSCNRHATHQGPDHQKAAVAFAHGEPCDEEAFEWLLKGAAGHYGLDKRPWDERLAWGKQHLDMLCAIAEDPLERLELWRGASDPWQLLQAAKAVRQWLEDPATPICCPVRLDQTCSGVGIVAALLRDERLARASNLIGSTRHDVYAQVAERVTALIREELELSGGAVGDRATVWLDRGIDRSLMKAAVVGAIYGATYQTMLDELVAHLDELQGGVEIWRLRGDVIGPARYLIVKVMEALQQELAPVFRMQKWLRELNRKVVSKQQRVRWTSPMGWPMDLGNELSETVSSKTTLTSTPRIYSRRNRPVEGELSALATSRGLMANAVHSYDAAFCQLVVCRAVASQAQILTNHDAFYVLPSRAGWLHMTLHSELRELFKVDWLTAAAVEIQQNAGLKLLLPPPLSGDLCVGRIGQNPYCFS